MNLNLVKQFVVFLLQRAPSKRAQKKNIEGRWLRPTVISGSSSENLTEQKEDGKSENQGGVFAEIRNLGNGAIRGVIPGNVFSNPLAVNANSNLNIRDMMGINENNPEDIIIGDVNKKESGLGSTPRRGLGFCF